MAFQTSTPSRAGTSYYNASQSTIGTGIGSEYTGYSRTSTLRTSANSRFNPGKTALQKSLKYFRRLIHVGQMDFEFALWQLAYLVISPQKVYRNFQYRKQTKDQFARDDPAFLVVLSGLLCLTSICFGLVMGLKFYDTLKLLSWVVIFDCIGSGLCIATALWWLSNRYLRTASANEIEWAYAFDVHLNAFIPLLIILHGVQLVFISLINQQWWISTLVGNTFWLIALSYYFYITFLGYSALNFLKKTTIFLMPIIPCIMVWLLSVMIGWNFTSSLIRFYHARL